MSTPPAADPAEGQAGGTPAEGEVPSPGSPPEEQEAPEEQDARQDARSAWRDLKAHSPRTVFEDRARFGGGFTSGDQLGVSGGQVYGDVNIHTTVLGAGRAFTTGRIPAGELTALAATFVEGPAFQDLTEQLRRERCLVVSGGHSTGRRAAALMSLHRLGLAPVKALDRNASPGTLAGQLDGSTRGYLLSDLEPDAEDPLSEHYLRALRDRLAKDDAYLVITAGPDCLLEDITPARWEPPAPLELLQAYLDHHLRDDGQAESLLTLPATRDFIAFDPHPGEAAVFAQLLLECARGKRGAAELADYVQQAAGRQVASWLTSRRHDLRDRSFLLALGAFDGAPYAVTAELADDLFRRLQRTEDPGRSPGVPVFGTTFGGRLQLARARRTDFEEESEWGPVRQTGMAFHSDLFPVLLMRAAWTGHPSARGALVGWLRELARDGRAVVRTRAALTAAYFADADVVSAMALLIEPWAGAQRNRDRYAAANALALAFHLGVTNVTRVLDVWSTGDDARHRWTAVRCHALLGPDRPAETVEAICRTARFLVEQENQADAEWEDLTDAVELLLSDAGARPRVLPTLVRPLSEDRAERDLAVYFLALRGFLQACRQTEDGAYPVLGWYAQAGHTGEATAIAALWRAALGDRMFSDRALDIMRQWIRSADRDETTEWALAALLPVLVETDRDFDRLSHLLRTIPGRGGSPPPAVAARLHSVLRPS